MGLFMIHELREYRALPGRAEDLHRRFADDTLALFAEFGLQVEGFWHEAGNRARIVYLLAFPRPRGRGRALGPVPGRSAVACVEGTHRERWAAHLGDPEHIPDHPAYARS